MFPRNAASPEPIAIGPVVQISDGAVQTSGCTVRIKPIGVAEADGAGTTAYSTDGVVLYTPTQAETNYTSFVLIAKKTGCIPASITVITTASATPGTVLLAPVTHTSAVVPTVTTLTNLPAITANWITTAGITDGAFTAAKFAASSLNGKGDWNVGKTGYTLTATTGLGNQTADITGTITTATNLTNLPAITAGWLTAAGIAASALDGKGNWNIGKTGYSLTATTGLGNQTANITGNLSGSVGSVSGSVGSISGVTFPTNFGDLAITVTTGRVTVGTNADKTGYSLTATTGLGNQTSNITGTVSGNSTHSAADVWAAGTRTLTAFGFTVTTSNAADVTAILADTNELQTDWTNGGRLDLILDDILTDTGTTLQAEIDGVQADTEDIQSRLPAALVSGRIDASVGAMAANTLTASALAADAVTEIQSGLSTLTAANVNAEVLDVLQVDTFAELGAVPAATSSLKDKLTWLFMWFRNKSTETATQRKLYADDTSTVVSTEGITDDGTTFTKTEAS